MREDQAEAKEQPSQTNTIWQELEAWGHTFKPWQKIILGHAVRLGRLDDDQINQAYKLFLQDNGLAQTAEPPVEVLPITGRPASATKDVLHLAGMGNLCAINAIPQSAKLLFGPQLTVIYGGNGTGKSGFVRVLSKACFSRDQRDILPNIYEENPPKQSARIDILSGGKHLPEIIFDASTEHPELKRISVFNTSVASSLLTEQNPLCFKPAGFDVFPEMARVYGELIARLNSDIAGKSQENKFVKSFLTPSSPISETIATLNADTDIKNLRKLAVYGDAEVARLQEIQSQIDDLKSKSVAEKIRQLEEAKRDLDVLEKQLTRSLTPLREAKRVEYRYKIATHKAKAKTAAEHGAESFRQTFFSKTGTPEWKHFVEAAYTLGKAEHTHYPRGSDHCLLCQRPLDKPSQQFIERLWAFLLADAQREEKDAKMQLAEAARSLQAISLNFFTGDSRAHGHLTRLNPPLTKAVEALVTKAQQNQAQIIEALQNSTETIPPDQLPDLVPPLKTLILQIEADITTLRQSNVEEAIKKLDAERVVLRHRQLLKQLLPDIENFVSDALWAKKASGTPKRNLNPLPITNKENELFSKLIAENYRKRLVEECSALDCNLPVEFRAKGQRGQTVRSLEMNGHSPEEVLSEGEQRAVALADFLTEVSLNPAGAGIILDDPVNSQDHERKEKIALRLVKEANTRQVIIFTHDLVFLTMLGAAAKDEMADLATHWVAKDATTGIPGSVSLNDSPDFTRDYMNTQRAKASLAEAKKAAGSAQIAYIRRGMDELRRTIEEIIPEYLFKGIVRRWSDRIIVTALKKVEWDDAQITEIVAIFEEISAYIGGHTHTEVRAGAPPEPKHLEAFITRVDNVIGNVKKEKKANAAPKS